MQNKLNKKINKKGISEVVAVVFIVFISIIAISILFVSIRQLVDFSPQLSCTQLQIKQVFEIKDACFDADNNKVITTLKRSLDDTEILSIEYAISSETDRFEFSCGFSCGGCFIQDPGSTKTFYLDVIGIQGIPESLLIKANGCALQNTEILPNC